ncbi:hypothetical protein VMCG_10133 [Cytospora schulzeri]|uniref:Uncharacterized protein n=1 Tax=Cytospora schulzeri TaxID=448051 RepID=A0A423VDP3_9PEZI|nr:hypothetical protein VMCG_10133 [Valsa malicola]
MKGGKGNSEDVKEGQLPTYIDWRKEGGMEEPQTLLQSVAMWTDDADAALATSQMKLNQVVGDPRGRRGI